MHGRRPLAQYLSPVLIFLHKSCIDLLRSHCFARELKSVSCFHNASMLLNYQKHIPIAIDTALCYTSVTPQLRHGLSAQVVIAGRLTINTWVTKKGVAVRQSELCCSKAMARDSGRRITRVFEAVFAHTWRDRETNFLVSATSDSVSNLPALAFCCVFEADMEGHSGDI